MFAHASGFSWDEGLLVLAPVALVAGLLIWGRRGDSKTSPANSAETKPQ